LKKMESLVNVNRILLLAKMMLFVIATKDHI